MEYLMTYGWAIVVIVIVLAVLAAMFSNSQSFEYCSFNPVGSFTCEGNPAIYEVNTGNEMVKLKFRNNYQDVADITSYTCAGYTPPSPPPSFSVAPGEVATLDVDCGDVGTAGGKFDQDIEIKYQLPADKDANSFRTATATVRGTIGSQ